MTATAMIGLFWMCCSLLKTIKMEGRRGLRSWPLRCLSQFLSERKERCSGGGGGGDMSRVEMCIRIGVPFTDGVSLYL